MTPPPLEEPDIVQLVLQRVLARSPAVTQEVVIEVDREVRALYGGMRVRIPKRGKYLSAEQRQQAYADALADMPEQDLLRKHKIGRATLYRLVKKGPA